MPSCTTRLSFVVAVRVAVLAGVASGRSVAVQHRAVSVALRQRVLGPRPGDVVPDGLEDRVRRRPEGDNRRRAEPPVGSAVPLVTVAPLPTDSWAVCSSPDVSWKVTSPVADTDLTNRAGHAKPDGQPATAKEYRIAGERSESRGRRLPVQPFRTDLHNQRCSPQGAGPEHDRCWNGRRSGLRRLMSSAAVSTVHAPIWFVRVPSAAP